MATRPKFTITPEVAQVIARTTADEPNYAEFIIPANGGGNRVWEAFAHIKVVSALIYCIGGLNANGTPQNLSNPLYLGRTKDYLLDSRSNGEEGVPFVIAETSLSETQSARIFVNGDAGDRLILIYR